jgi:hypothetical protein
VRSNPTLSGDVFGLCDTLCQNANRAAGLKPDGSQPPDANVGLGLGYLGQWGGTGESREIGFAANMRGGKFCFYTQVCKNDAAGFCAAVGFNVSFQAGSLKSGSSKQGNLFAAGGSGPAANVSMSKDSEGNVGGIKGLRGGVGFGGAAGAAQCQVEYTCFP